uniref:Uncharacterized protein n=1 Tax=Molossus molossus TaxID=27622 RepID=A0A7J8GQJ0_MOLMO|nr:hypothetical protein HJG59_011328 [Molossus molossus]
MTTHLLAKAQSDFDRACHAPGSASAASERHKQLACCSGAQRSRTAQVLPALPTGAAYRRCLPALPTGAAYRRCLPALPTGAAYRRCLPALPTGAAYRRCLPALPTGAAYRRCLPALPTGAAYRRCLPALSERGPANNEILFQPHLPPFSFLAPAPRPPGRGQTEFGSGIAGLRAGGREKESGSIKATDLGKGSVLFQTQQNSSIGLFLRFQRTLWGFLY